MTTLYRAAAAESPHFGLGSYWTPSEDFARRFRFWLDEHFKDRHAVYRAEVELSDVLDVPFGVFLDSAKVTRRAGRLAASYRWVSFYERGAFEGTMIRQYVYLGDEPIRAEALEPGAPCNA